MNYLDIGNISRINTESILIELIFTLQNLYTTNGPQIDNK